MVDGVRVEDDQLKRLGQFENPLDLTLNLGCEDRNMARAAHLKLAQLLKERELFLAGIDPNLAFRTFTQTGACVGSLHDGLLVQHWSFCQRQISSHPCDGDPKEKVSDHITFPFQRIQSCTVFQLKINHRHHHVSYRPWKCDVRQNPTSVSGTQPVLLCTKLQLCMQLLPTCRQICASGSQTRLSASCQLPGTKTARRGKKKQLLAMNTLFLKPKYKM